MESSHGGASGDGVPAEQGTYSARQVEQWAERQRALINELRADVNRTEERLSKTQAELSYVQQQLEFVVVNLEREDGIVADHTEQLRLFAHETAKRRGHEDAEEGRRSVMRQLASWLYTPMVNFVKGVYTLLSPFINTVQVLSLFNSDVLQRHSEEHVRSRWGEARKGDLLGMLQNGALDPTLSPGRRGAVTPFR